MLTSIILVLLGIGLVTTALGGLTVVKRVEELEGRIGDMGAAIASLKRKVPYCPKGGTSYLMYSQSQGIWLCEDPGCHRTDCPYMYKPNAG